MRHDTYKGLIPSCPSTIMSLHRQTCRTETLSFLFMAVYLQYQSVVLLGWEVGRMEGMEGEATKGCKLIRFLSLHAPLPVLLLSNPGGQRCAAQRLNSQTQWGNNWYKQHLAAETLSVTPNDTFLLFLLPALLPSPTAVSLIQKLFIRCSTSSFIPSFYRGFVWIFTFCL